MKLKFILIFFGIFIGASQLHAQEQPNQNDENGQRHGVWKKYFPGTKQLRYEGQFEHGKEKGTFKFYCENCKDKPTAVKEFKSNSTISDVKYFTIKGQLVSEGQMDGKLRIGEWVYYHKKNKDIMTREFYENGLLNGKKITYYPSGKITEEINFNNGLMNGANLYYSPDSVLLKELQYVNDKLHGLAKYFDASGNLTIEGSYKQGKKNGLWKYYKNGKLELEETYPKPLKKIEN